MKPAAITLILLASAAAAQEKKPTPGGPATQKDIPGDTVVATVNGRDFTADELRRLVAGSPFPQAKTMFQRNPADFLRAQGVLLAYTDIALKQGLEKQSPYKEQLEFYRLHVLSNAALNHQRQTFTVQAEQQEAYYKAHTDEFREVRVRMIYIPFSGDAGSEAAAKAKASEVAKQAMGGNDFVALAKANAADPTGAGADFVVRRDSAQPPPHMKTVLLAAAPGTVTEPLRHENGYYVFRVEESKVQPYTAVKDQIYNKLQDDQFRQWQMGVQSNVQVQIKNEAFFGTNGQQ